MATTTRQAAEASAYDALADKLDSAATIIAEATATLDRTTEPCSCCGRRSARNLLEFKAGEALESHADKVRGWATALREKRDLAPRVTAAKRAGRPS